MESLTLNSPAKINLYLEVLKKRKDGFHEIETIFERISLFDQISLAKIKKGIEIVSADKIPLNWRNLAYQAAKLFLKRFNLPWGVRIRIRKQIPVASGLGGASSNAATVLLGLSKLSGLRLKKQALSPLAKLLGADVCFFLSGFSRAIGRGRGELLVPQPVKQKLHYVLVSPRLEMSTRRVYRAFRLGLTRRRQDVKILKIALRESNLNLLAKMLFNRLEEVVLPEAKVIVRIKEALNSLGIRAVLMSGSGSSAFGIVKTREEANDFCRRLKLRHKQWRVFAVETC